jgi:hypothetical protein
MVTKRTIFKILMAVFAFVVTLIIGLVLLVIVLEDKIIESTISQINQKLNVTLKVREVKVSVISAFPKVSVKMKRVEIVEGSLDTPAELETGLLSLDEIALRFGVWGLLTNKFQLDELVLKNGWINLYFDNSGKGNFEIFSGSEGDGSNWLFDLDAIKFENINLSYIDLRTGWVFKGYIDNAALRGKLSSHLIEMSIRSKGLVGSLRQGSFYYLRNQRVSLNTDFIISNNVVNIIRSDAAIGSTKVLLEGSIGREEGLPVNLAIKGSDLGVETLLALLTQHNLTLPAETKTKGKVAFVVKIEGVSKVDKPFNVNLDFITNRIDLKLPNKPLLSLINVEGNFNNGNLGKPESSEIMLSKMTIETGSSFVQGTLRLKNILSPLYHLNVNQSISVVDILDWGFDIPLYRGELVGNFEALGLLSDINSINVSAFENSKFYSTSTIKDVAFRQVGYIPDVQELSGTIVLSNQDITNAKVKGKLHGSNFEAELQASNATAIIFGNRKAIVNTNITIESLNTEWLLAEKENTESTDEGESTWSRIHSISGDIFIDELTHNKFILKPFSANVYLKENSFFCNSFLGRSCDGIFTGRFSVCTPKDKDLILSADINLDGVEVSDLFSSFNNFYQNVITSKNISGKLDGTIVFNTPIRKGEVVRSDFEGFSSFKISNGRLTNVAQLEKLSRFISLDELKDIKFNTIENNIRVENQMIIIPQMDVKSSAINLAVSGTHSFSGKYHYRIQLLLSDILFKKASSRKPENNQFGEVEADGSGRTKLFLKLEGDDTNFNVSYDGASAREAFKQNLRQEKETLRSVLRDEFKFLRKSQENTDSLSLTKPSKKLLDDKDAKKKQTKFTIEWDD